MPSALAEAALEAGVDIEPKAASKSKPNGQSGIFASANAVPVVAVLGWLGLLDGEQPICPGCRETDPGVAIVGNGLKCQHARCAQKGVPGKPGFRTCVDLVMEARSVDARESSRLLCERFEVETSKRPDDNSHDWVDNLMDPANDRSEPVALPDRNGEEPPKEISDAPRRTKVELVHLASLLEPALERAEQRRTGAEQPVPLPFRDYSEALCGGLFAGVHTTVSGTGAGKSAFWFQCATHAAQQQVPVLYVGLELSKFQVALRTLGNASGVSWSRLYTGRSSPKDIERAREALPELSGLPFFVEFGSAHGWDPSNLTKQAEQIRALYPDKPMLVVLDFLQLVGADPVPFGRQPDLRERIGRASYAGVHVANNLGASVVLISSAARDKYGLIAGAGGDAGLTARVVPGHSEPIRTILHPETLIGLGKESGEIEYAAESQTVLVKWPAALESGERVVIAAIPKLRYGPPRWVPFRFWQRFEELPFKGVEDLPEVPRRGGKGPAVADDELEDRVLATVRKHAGLKSKNAISERTTGAKEKVLKTIARLLDGGKLSLDENGSFVAGGENR